MKKHIQTLKRFNAWRRGDDVIEQPNPKEVGQAIDAVIEYLAALQRERDIWKHEAQLLWDELKIADKAIEDNTSMIFKLMDENRKSPTQISIAKNEWLN
jgi:RecB family exonuclease